MSKKKPKFKLPDFKPSGKYKVIKLKHVRPGMIIRSPRWFELVVYISKPGANDTFFGKDPYIDGVDLHDPYWGRTLAKYDPEDKVEIITGKKRKELLQYAVRKTRQRILDTERDLRTIETLIGLSSTEEEIRASLGRSTIW